MTVINTPLLTPIYIIQLCRDPIAGTNICDECVEREAHITHSYRVIPNEWFTNILYILQFTNIVKHIKDIKSISRIRRRYITHNIASQ